MSWYIQGNIRGPQGVPGTTSWTELTELPAVMVARGNWNASTNSPELSDGVGTPGDAYRVSTAGTVNFGSGSINLHVDDWIILDGDLVWRRISGTGITYSGVLPSNAQNGVTTVFELPQATVDPGRVQVFRNGLMEVPGIGFSASSTQITFSSAPLGTDVIAVSFPV